MAALSIVLAIPSARATGAKPNSAHSRHGQARRRHSPPIAFAGCIANHGAWGCEESAHDALAAASGVAVSPDGADVYVASSFNIEQPSIGGNSVTIFERAPDGALREQGCVANLTVAPDLRAPHGCEVAPGAPLYGAERVIVSPDGQNVYVISRGRGVGEPSAITELARLPGGGLAPLGCISTDTSSGCAPFPHHGSEEKTTISGLVIAPDGSDVYVRASESSAATGGGASSISQFARAADGTLTEVSCIAAQGAGGCVTAPDGWYFGELAVSPDGDDLYSLGSDSVQQLTIGADGVLIPHGCIGYRTAGQCAAGGPSLFALSQIAVASDGGAVDVGGSDSLTELVRAADGSLAQSSCLSSGRHGDALVRGCATTKRNRVGVSLLGDRGIAASSDGRIYLTHLNGVTVYGHEPDGDLVERGCIANNGRGGSVLTPECARTQHPSLRGADSLAVSPNGHSIYVASLAGLSVTWFKRPATR